MDKISMKHSHHTITHAARRALLTPFWCGALGLLILNDHILKAAYPGLVTGKLSDVAGLFLVPALSSAMLPLRSMKQVKLVAACAGALFAAINLFPEVALIFDRLASHVMPFHTTADPTDVWTLLALVPGVALITRQLDQTRPHSRVRMNTSRALVLAGALACIASGRPPEDDRISGAAQFNGTVTILNQTNELHNITIQQLGTNFSFNCEDVARDPESILTPELFENSNTQAFTVPLFSGEEIAVDPNEWNDSWNFTTGGSSTCPAFLVQSNALPDIVVFYEGNFLRFKTYYHNIDVPQDLMADEQTIVIEADYSDVAEDEERLGWREITCPEENANDWWETDVEWGQCNELPEKEIERAARRPQGARYSWRSMNQSVPLLYQRPLIDDGMPLRVPARCRVPGPGEGLFWEDVPFIRETALLDIEQGRDGCHTMRFDGDVSWTVCAPYEALAPLLDEPAARISLTEQFGDSEQVDIEVTDHDSLYTITLFKGQSLSSFYDLYWAKEVREGCAPIAESCGEVSLPIDLRLTSQSNRLVAPGESVELSFGEFHLVRAVYTPLRNLSCSEGVDRGFASSFFDVSKPVVEGVIVARF